MIEQEQIDISEVTRILALQEGHFMDVKSAQIAPAKLSESISAFANSAGGELFIGIAENDDKTERSWLGFVVMEAANGLFQILQAMAPIAGQYRATWLHCPGQTGSVLHLIIPKTAGIAKATNGSPYIRRNAQNLRVATPDALERLQRDKGISSFEDEAVNADSATITNSIIGNEFVLNVVPAAEPEDWMKKQHLLINGKPVVAGVLLFADEPQAALPKRSAIKVYRYKTREEAGSREQLAGDPVTIEGPLYNQISEAVAMTKAMIERGQTLGREGLSPVVYPPETLHEVITNAVLHRDYSLTSDVHVRIFDNRVEVESPGRLAGHITTENVLNEQFARNPRIVRLINKFPNPPNKDVGEGLNTAFEAMVSMGLQEPEIEERDNAVVVNIRHTPIAAPHETVMGYLKNHNEITNRIGRELTGIRSENAMKNVFIQLKERKLIEPVPGKRGNASAWRKHTGYWDEPGIQDLFDDKPPVE